MFWLSHHHPDELDRCYSFAGLHICARCLGTYPVLFFFMAFQFKNHWPLIWELDVPIGVALVAPATLDWAYARFKPHAFSNPWRTLTGVLLGLGLGRSLFIHLQKPLPEVLLAQGAFVLTVVAVTFAVRLLRK
jgi:uncharacterized membrane protein